MFLFKYALAILFSGCLLLPMSIKSQYTIQSEYGNLTDCDTMTRGFFVIWWDQSFDYSAIADELLDSLIHYRNICLTTLGMEDPPNPEAGYYYNVYIHTPGNADDLFSSNDWGVGQGTDVYGYPFLTFTDWLANDGMYTSHEAFHVFQYSSNAPGYAYSGDSQWFIEASAEWFAQVQNSNDPYAFTGSKILTRIPQVPLWTTGSNMPSSYPSNWQRGVHQYALGLLLYYMTEVMGLPDTLITSGFFNGTNQLPQEYLYHQLGGQVFRTVFTEFIAHMINDFDFIDSNQLSAAENEWNTYAAPNDHSEFIETYTNSGTDDWYRPTDSVVTTAWSFNTYKLVNSENNTYTFQLRGDELGTYSDSSHFRAQVIVKNSLTGTSYHDLIMTNHQEGALTLPITPNDTALFFVIASMPEVFQDPHPTFQLFPYEMRITKNLLGITHLDESFMHVYPNPVDKFLHIDLKEYSSQVDVEVYSTLGQKILRKTYVNTDEIYLDFSSLHSNAMYFLNVSTNNHSKVTKFMKK